jgi:hypothetical protein
VRLHVLDAEGTVEHLSDVAVPVIDGMPLFTYFEGETMPGIAFSYAAPPSRHWLGEPSDASGETALLDGTCGVAGCCGVSAHVDLGDEVVTWSDFLVGPSGSVDLGPFRFERVAYEATLAACGDLTPVPWRFTGAGRILDEHDAPAREPPADRLRGWLMSAITWPVDARRRRDLRRRYPDAIVFPRSGRDRGWFMYSTEVRRDDDQGSAD